MSILLKNIKQLLQIRSKEEKILLGSALKNIPYIENAFLFIAGDNIHSFGEMKNLESQNFRAETIIDAKGKIVFPTYIDSHTHLIFAQSRENEFEDRINGLTYEQIASRGGGILNSAKKLQQKTENELFNDALQRLKSVVSMGTGAIEIKSGYGLTVEDELKMLRVATMLSNEKIIPVKRTFLGAHAFPLNIERSKYVSLIINEMIPQVAAEQLADYIDVFCETNYFTTDETAKILEQGIKFGLKPKIHVNQFNSIGGIQTAIEYNAISVDHLEVMKEHDFQQLQNKTTIATLLPSCSFFLGIPYAPARELIERDIPINLATDYNPGSTPNGNMNFVLSLACIKMKMTPFEALNSATFNASFSLEMSDKLGSITEGKKANLIITEPIDSFAYIPYSFGKNAIDSVIINGKVFSEH